MSFEDRGVKPPKIEPVAYPGSVLRFRGPKRSFEEPFVLCLGGSETFGQFIAAPYAEQLNRQLAPSVINMGVINAGLDVLASDLAIRTATQKASAVVLQITGAHNMTNRFYGVHPRRNDRFLKATRTMRAIYHDVDFTEFHFTRHLLTHLRAVSQDRFVIIVNELQAAWEARITGLVESIDAPVHLLWLSNRRPDEIRPGGLGGDPLFVTASMLKNVCKKARSLTIAVAPPSDEPDITDPGIYGVGNAAAARALPGPEAHDAAATQLASMIEV